MIRLTIDINNQLLYSIVIVNKQADQGYDPEENDTSYEATMYSHNREPIVSCMIKHNRNLASHQLFIATLQAFANQFQLDWNTKRQYPFSEEFLETVSQLMETHKANNTSIQSIRKHSK